MSETDGSAKTTSELPAPGKIIAIHLNYPSRAAQRGTTPAHPSYFLKPSSSLAQSGDAIELPLGTELLAYEGEIALIIGSVARRVSPDDGWHHVSGITAANDFGLYDLRAVDKGSNVRSKGGDGYTPWGPNVIPARKVKPDDLRVRTWVNGALVQEDRSDTLLFPFGQLIADLSQMMTLHPGDVILTGTPAGSSVAIPGDVVEVEVDAPGGVETVSTGRLTTHVTQGTIPFADYGAHPKIDDSQRIAAWGDRSRAGLEPEFDLTDELIAELASVGVATLSVQLRKRGYNDVSIDGVASNQPGAKIIGRARTLRYVPHRPDLFATHGGGYNAQKRLIDSLHAGDVVVMEARGEAGTGTLGDVLALRAQKLGAAGFITDGGVRDFDIVAGLNIPTFSKGPHPAVLGRRHIPWDLDITISCGGATVQPGDVIVGDGDGVVVIPPALVAEVVADAIVQEREEVWIAARVAEGYPIKGLFPMNSDWRARFLAETVAPEKGNDNGE